MTASFPTPGDSIGRFRVIAQLGAGGMGVVYDALEVNLERRVALKVISPQLAGDPDFRARFASEARALASLDSPHVVQVYAHGEEDGYLYIATQLIPDGDLGQMLTRWGPPPLGKALELIEQVASGLHDAHTAGFVHRDIKPGNVLVRRRGADTVQAYLGDFGIARRIDAEVTRIGSVVAGTPSYMAPELHSGAQAGLSTDIYSLGCLLWVALTGQPPYSGATEFEIAGAHMTSPVPQLPTVSPMTEALNRALRVSMAKEPGHRYRSALALRDDLRECLRMTDDPTFGVHAATLSGSAPTQLGGGAPHVSRTPTPSVPPSSPASPSSTSSWSSVPSSPGPSGVPRHLAASSPTAAPPSGPPSGYGAPPRSSGGSSGGSARGSRRGLWIGLSAAAVAIIIGGGAAIVAGTGGDDDNGGGGGAGGGGGGGASGRSAESQEFLDSDADAILLAAEKDMRVLDSVRMSGTVDQDGQPGGVEMTITSAGDCDGELSIGDGTAQLRRIDGEAWLRPDRAFLEASNTDGSVDVDLFMTLIGDKWLKADATQSDDFADLCDLDELLEGDGGTSDGEAAKGEVTEIEGQEVVAITTADGSDTTVAQVRLEAPHYVLRLENEADNGRFDLSGFDEPFTAEAPPADEVIDPADFTG
ncbi:serine/threonine-protein kinase [Nocardioides sp. 1609]|uniref:serine/threonine-protein kinase n=1 Tax=Nocardioides sp. 1609 TaxID=2508327 RepID=UPI0014304181|nr:serine/threonine-protein kinase [Nocardioides sp. 1609]